MIGKIIKSQNGNLFVPIYEERKHVLRPDDFDFANSEVKEFTESIEVTTAKRLRTQASSSVNAQSLDADRSAPPKRLPTHASSSLVNAQSLDADRYGPGESEERRRSR